MRVLLADLIDLVLPVSCAVCGAAGAALCAGCVASVAGPCSPVPAAGVPCWSAGPYGGVRREAILEYKERGRADLAAPLGAVLGRAVLAALPGLVGGAAPVVLVPVPSTAAAARARGGDHVRGLARFAAREVRAAGVACAVVPALSVRGRRHDSAGLGAASRAANMAGSMAVRARALGRLPAARLVVVDDLITTGATLGEAARALAAAGRPPVAAAVLAATELRVPRRPADAPAENARGSGL